MFEREGDADRPARRAARRGPRASAGRRLAVAALWQQRQLERVVLVGTAASRFAVAPLAPELHERALVLHGETDDTVPLQDVLQWARPQNLPITVIPGVGHFFHGQLPLLRGLVVRHLQGVSGAA